MVFILNFETLISNQSFLYQNLAGFQETIRTVEAIVYLSIGVAWAARREPPARTGVHSTIYIRETVIECFINKHELF